MLRVLFSFSMQKSELCYVQVKNYTLYSFSSRFLPDSPAQINTITSDNYLNELSFKKTSFNFFFSSGLSISFPTYLDRSHGCLLGPRPQYPSAIKLNSVVLQAVQYSL